MLLACFATSACASQSLDIKPVKIEVFSDTNVFAMDESGKYQIGQIGCLYWSGGRFPWAVFVAPKFHQGQVPAFYDVARLNAP